MGTLLLQLRRSHLRRGLERQGSDRRGERRAAPSDRRRGLGRRVRSGLRQQAGPAIVSAVQRADGQAGDDERAVSPVVRAELLRDDGRWSVRRLGLAVDGSGRPRPSSSSIEGCRGEWISV